MHSERTAWYLCANENNLYAYGSMVSGGDCLFILDWPYQFRHPSGVIQLGDRFR